MNSQDVSQILGEVEDCLHKGKPALAVDVLYRGLWRSPSDVELLRRLGLLCARLERWEEARTAFERVEALSPGAPDVQIALGALAGKRREISSSPINFGTDKYLQFSVHRCFTNGVVPLSVLWEVLGDLLVEEDGLAFYGHGPFLDDLLALTPDLARLAVALIADDPTAAPDLGLPVVTPATLPATVRTVFLCGTRMFDRIQMLRRLPAGLRVIDAGLLSSSNLAPQLADAWAPTMPHAYPLTIPDIVVRPDLDVLILDCPARTLALMPNGVGYVSNALKKTGLGFQVLDLDVFSYHRYHMHRLFDVVGSLTLPDGTVLPVEPWLPEHHELWSSGKITHLVEDEVVEIIEQIVAARPKVLGFSVHACNRRIASRIAQAVRAQVPEIAIIAGGYSCQNEAMGMRGFPDADYMCIGEADLTVGPLCQMLAAGQRPKDLPGIMSRFDTPGRRFVPGPRENDLDRLDFPRYDWVPSLDLYRNYTGYQLTPIIASRGCRWSRCSFCAERFYWRIRSAANFCDELQWLAAQGCNLYMFNESDLNGMPERLLEICDEVIRRNIKVLFTGQLRIHAKSDQAFFDKLAAAGFTALRFGVDAFSDRTLKLQAKGYTMKTVEDNLRACHKAGIAVSVNWVIGVPGETDADIDEGVAFLASVRECVAKVDNINQLGIVNGSIYWLSPEKHNIHYRRPKEDLYEEFPNSIPTELWWSEEPYIDDKIRLARYEQAVVGLVRSGVRVGPFAAGVIDRTLKSDPRLAAAADMEERIAMLAHP
ncbi:hypothetical protein CU669_19340 [Paramagnetospirillum kuznetsovii]|uniref:Uncharacterized protein n=1 Tax=Paramagnetospirillum kuznetsovii TaxID=2053833 RepID=A0A364NT97_9PROT|nr:radical SAM protein [Paramagnetospirillum kuznetsovii]RAU20262.1 hypothetical protein CU669_19340 [Paramagnetospirillum kuznetsovii]